MGHNYKRQDRSPSNGSPKHPRRRRRSASSSSRSSSRRRVRRSHHRKPHKYYSRERNHPSHNNRRDHRYRKRSPSPSSSSSPSPSSSPSESSSVSSSTRRRRNTPHFKFRIGEKLSHRYRVTRLLGTGTFGRVVQARYNESLFAIKIIKPVDKYVDSAKTERSIVKTLNEADPEDRSRIVRFIESFYHHQYFCMVFEPLGPSLYDVIKRNNHAGFPLKLVQAFARQMLESVAFMHANSYTHTDLKPENVLLCRQELQRAEHSKSESYSLPVSEEVKLIDFGGATHSKERHSSVINTRQYRSPQVILQCCDWKDSSDVWSLGCIIPQLYTGNLLFPTHDDLEHLLMILKNAQKTKFPAWMPKRCKNELFKVFKGDEIDERVANKRVKHWEDIVGLKRVDEIFKEQPELSDLISKCLEIDPALRISCAQALKHPFFDLKL